MKTLQNPKTKKALQLEELNKQCRRVIIDGKSVLVAPRGCSVSSKVFINQD